MKSYVSHILLLLALIVVATLAVNYSHAKSTQPFVGVTTVAGSDSVGDGQSGTGIVLKNPSFFKAAPNGEIFIADTDNNRVRKIGLNGKIETIAGIGSNGDSGEGGLAVNAQINRPSSLDINSQGEVIFVDEGNRKVKKIATNGIITTLVGTFQSGGPKRTIMATSTRANETSVGDINGVAVHPITNEVYFAGDYGGKIFKLTNDGFVELIAGIGRSKGGYNGDGPALSRRIVANHLLFNSAGDLYYSDASNSRILRLISDQIKTIAGTGSIGYSGDGGSALDAQIASPQGLAFRPGTENIVFADYGNNVVREILSNGNITTIAGKFGVKRGDSGEGGLAIDAVFDFPGSVTFKDGELLIIDINNSKIKKVSNSGIISTFAGGSIGDGLSATKNGLLQTPEHVSVTSTGELIISDTSNGLIRLVSSNGIISTIAGNKLGSSAWGNLAIDTLLASPKIAIKRPNGDIYFASGWGQYIAKLSATDGKITLVAGSGSGFAPDGSVAVESPVNFVHSIGFNSMNELVYTERSNNRIRKIFENGTVGTIAGIDDGSIGTTFSGDGGLAVDAGLGSPSGFVIALNGELIFIDHQNYRIRKVLTNGTIITIAGNGDTNTVPDGSLAIESSIFLSGDITINSIGEVIFTEYDRMIRKICFDGTLVTVAGNESRNGFGGDGGLATDAYFSYPLGLSVDSNDNIYIADSSNNRIRKVSTICPSNYDLNGNECNPKCFGVSSNDSSVCSGRGKCDDVNTCYCTQPYFGSNCEMFNCYGIAKNSSQVCSSRGVCSSLDNCACATGYYGNNCESFNCSGIDSNSKQVCSGRGLCSGPGKCECNAGYYGNNCESFNCSGIDSKSAQVCSAQGLCLSPGVCSCNGAYYGANCQYYNCSGVDSNSKQVCSGHGSCVAPGNCSCTANYYGNNCELVNCPPGYSGSSCELFNCSGISSTSPLVCSSGNGTCSSPNNCTCKSGFYGTNCESYNCKGVKSTNPSVCSSRGQCTAPDTCLCSGKSLGSNCEFLITPSIAKTSNLTALRSARLGEGNSISISMTLTIILFVTLLSLFH